MTQIVRGTVATLICVGMGISGATSSALADPNVLVKHHVDGWVTMAAKCGANQTISLIENWYVRPGDRLIPAGNTLKGLTTRTIASSQPHPDTGYFKLGWSEPNPLSRVPWTTAFDTRSGELVTAYRNLTLVMTGSVDGLRTAGTPRPAPVIAFFGTETGKNVGTITMDCIPQG